MFEGVEELELLALLTYFLFPLFPLPLQWLKMSLRQFPDSPQGGETPLDTVGLVVGPQTFLNGLRFFSLGLAGASLDFLALDLEMVDYSVAFGFACLVGLAGFGSRWQTSGDSGLGWKLCSRCRLKYDQLVNQILNKDKKLLSSSPGYVVQLPLCLHGRCGWIELNSSTSFQACRCELDSTNSPKDL
ncbi:hypothetical protein Tco_1523006 [Tanacetum coccineum]